MRDIEYYIKLITRYSLIIFALYLLKHSVDPEYIERIDKINNELPKYIIMTMASLATLIIGAHFNTRIERKNLDTQ